MNLKEKNLTNHIFFLSITNSEEECILEKS